MRHALSRKRVLSEQQITTNFEVRKAARMSAECLQYNLNRLSVLRSIQLVGQQTLNLALVNSSTASSCTHNLFTNLHKKKRKKPRLL